MKIEATRTFLDGRDRFEAGDIRTVDDERGAGFIALGWAKKVGASATEPASGEATLAIHNSTLGVTSTTKG